MKRFILFVLGTRPEAIKLAPLILQLRSHASLSPLVCVTAQHRDLLDGILARFGIVPDFDLDIMQPGQALSLVAARILEGLDPILAQRQPGLVVVQGDTTSCMAGSLAAFHRRIPVGHVEAGLRTGTLEQPFPEEANRILTTRLSTLHFAPTRRACDNLLAEQVPAERIFLTGNTGIDALLYTRERLLRGDWPGYAGPLRPDRRLILLTAHRRESFGEGFERICSAIAEIAKRDDVEIVYPVHPNPHVREVVGRRLAALDNVKLIEPQGYVPFVDLMNRAELLLTDSGGVQEEGPSLGKPLLILREVTERQEAVECGVARLLGTDTARIVGEVNRLLDSPSAREAMTAKENPFGDGQASARIAEAIHSFFGS